MSRSKVFLFVKKLKYLFKEFLLFRGVSRLFGLLATAWNVSNFVLIQIMSKTDDCEIIAAESEIAIVFKNVHNDETKEPQMK